MTATDTRFATDVAAIYAARLVPMLFEPYARVVAARIAAMAPRDVLETAAGTGVVTRELAARLPAARIVATDLNAPMLDVASSMTHDRVQWQPADAHALPFPDRTFDAVACQFGVMFFDRARAHAEARRVLRPGGRIVLATWDSIARNVLADVVTDALGARFPDDPPRFLPRVPYAYHDESQMRADLAEAGFVDIAIERVELVSRAADADDVALAFCLGTPLRHELEARGADAVDTAIDAVREAVHARFGAGPIAAPMSALVAEARA